MPISHVNGIAVTTGSTILGRSGLSHINGIALASGGGGGFDATIYGTVLAWYRAEDAAGADADPISNLADFSGNGWDLSQATSGNRPTKRTNVVGAWSTIRFDGSNDSLFRDGAIGDCGTVIAVVGRITHTNANAVATSNGKRLITFFPNATTIFSGDGDEYWGGSTPTRINGESPGAFPANPGFAVVVQSGTPSTFGTFGIGASGINDAFNGDLLEFVTFEDTLSTENQDAAAAALIAKYGL